MIDFTKSSTFNSDANFESIKFGDKAPVLEVELNELQDLLRNKLKEFIKTQIGDGINSSDSMTYVGGNFNVNNTHVIVDGELIYISSLSIPLTEGSSVYLDTYTEEIDYTDTIKKYGNVQETNEVVNKILDSRMMGFETSRRVGLKYNLSTVNNVADHKYLKLGVITSNEFVVESNSILDTNSDVINKIILAESNAKQYVDNQIQLVTATGIPKLVSYPYDLYALVEGQTIFEIPYDHFNKDTDTLMVFFNGAWRKRTDFSITNPIEVGGAITKGYITLNIGISLGSYVGLMILKNVPIGEEGAMSGAVIAVNSIPSNRIIGLDEELGSEVLETESPTIKGAINELVTQSSESMNILIPATGSTANSIILDIGTLKNNKRYSFKANANSTGNVTINEKAFKKLDGTQIGSGGVKLGKVYDFYYDSSADCVFILAKAEGDSTVADVLAGKIFSNGDDTGLIGTMPNNGTVNQSLAINGTYTIPKGYHNGTGKVTQSITTKAAATITPRTANQTIAANQYLSGVQTIEGDADLIAANIVSGKNIFGVAGTHENLTPFIAGTTQALYSSGANSYKRYSVDMALACSITSGLARGTVTVGYRLMWNTTSTTAAQIYVNGVARGVYHVPTTGSSIYYTEDISVEIGDVISIYIKSGYASGSIWTVVDNVTISCGNSNTYSMFT